VLPHPSKCEYESDLEVEMEADAFASNLLMPSHRFLTRARSGKVGLRTILDLAAHFEASVTSAAVRYVRADIVPCAVGASTRYGFQWKWLSTETWRANFRKTVESIERLPDDCRTRQALLGEPIPHEGFFEAGQLRQPGSHFSPVMTTGIRFLSTRQSRAVASEYLPLFAQWRVSSDRQPLPRKS